MNEVTAQELDLLFDQVTQDDNDYDDGRDGWFLVKASRYYEAGEVTDLALTSMFEFARADGGGIRRRVTARWRMELVDSSAEDFPAGEEGG